MNFDTTSPSNAVTLARLCVYRFLAVATSDPKSGRWAKLQNDSFTMAAVSAAQLLCDDPLCAQKFFAPGEQSSNALSLAPLVRILRDAAVDLNAEYERIFGLMMSKKCPPYETEFCPQTFSVYRSQALADVAGFYRAFGVEPSRETPERDDHISLELGFMAYLIAKEQRAPGTEQAMICRAAQQRFAREHLVWWAPAFARALEQQCLRVLNRHDGESSFYEMLAGAIAAFIPIERAILGIKPPTELVAPGPIEPQEEMTCSACAGSCETTQQ